MLITNNIEVKFNDPNEETTLGIHYQVEDEFPYDEETGITDFDAEPIEMHTLIIGFMLFSIVIYW